MSTGTDSEGKNTPLPDSLNSHTAVAEVDLQAILHNYRLLLQAREAAQGPEVCPELGEATGLGLPPLMPVVKADAYGHGHIEVSETLCRAGAGTFASGSVQEACMLRHGLAQKGLFPEIVSLLGPVTIDDWQLCFRCSVIPVVHSLEQLAPLQGMEAPEADRALFPAKTLRPALPVVVKCNSGMARLGFSLAELPALLDALEACSRHLGYGGASSSGASVRERNAAGMQSAPDAHAGSGGMRGIVPIMAVSHLACADAPDGPEQVIAQANVFSRMLALLRQRGPVAASLGNSAGTLLAEHAEAIVGPQVCRPGIALYGYSPLAGTPQEEKGHGLRPAMSVRTPVIALRELAPGESIGYGHTFTAARKTLVGIIAAGYADGFSRGLSNKGQVCIRGMRANILGRVSMQMSAVDLTPLAESGIRPALGEPVWIIGGSGKAAITADEQAGFWGSFNYEALCLLGMNARRYV